MAPTIGRVVSYRTPAGYSLPALVTGAHGSLPPLGPAFPVVPDLTTPEHAHLTVFALDGDPYLAYDVPPCPFGFHMDSPEAAGSWAWPARA